MYTEWGPQMVKRGLLPGRVQRIRVCWVHPEMRAKTKVIGTIKVVATSAEVVHKSVFLRGTRG